MVANVPSLTTRQINRSVLARQLLLERADLDIPTALQRIGGLQTQYAPSGYVGLWSRLANFERNALTRALEDRSVIQGTLMRSTIHMVAAADYWPICAGIRASRREWWERIARARHLGEIPYELLTQLLRDELAAGPRPSKELIAAMERAGLPKALWEGAGLWLDMVRVPPSGTWDRRRADLYGLAEQWVRPVKKPSEGVGLRLLVTKYLRAFGPAPLEDAANWAGVPKRRMEPVVAKMNLRTFRDETDTVVLDIPDGEL
ncbi:MAG TPA: crosslink repair DNA glycosylase YcaQ family protein, partial [Ilumatobacteraceae bacterium]